MIKFARILHSASECAGLVADRSIALAPYVWILTKKTGEAFS